jgi:hypothetical protein
MNYLQILEESLRIFRTTKLAWVFGFIALLVTIPQPLSQSLRGDPFLVCIYLFVSLVIILISVTAYGGLIYLIYQTTLNRNPGFSEAWLHGGQKLFRNIGFALLITPVLIVALIIYWNFAVKAPTSPFLWLLVLLITAFLGSLITFGLCAIMIDGVNAFAAAWTSFLITGNNYFRVLVIQGSVFFIRFLLIVLLFAVLASGLFKFDLTIPLTFDYLTYQKIMAIPVFATAGWIIDLLLIPLTSAILTLCYLQFTKEIHYPAISNR